MRWGQQSQEKHQLWVYPMLGHVKKNNASIVFRRMKELKEKCSRYVPWFSLTNFSFLLRLVFPHNEHEIRGNKSYILGPRGERSKGTFSFFSFSSSKLSGPSKRVRKGSIDASVSLNESSRRGEKKEGEQANLRELALLFFRSRFFAPGKVDRQAGHVTTDEWSEKADGPIWRTGKIYRGPFGHQGKWLVFGRFCYSESAGSPRLLTHDSCTVSGIFLVL